MRWVKLHKSMLEWRWHDQPETVSLFVHLIMMARETDGEWRGTGIGRGQLVTCRRELAERTGLTERQVRTCLERLKSTGEIAVMTTNRHSVITVTNYATYQDTAEGRRPAERPATPPAGGQPGQEAKKKNQEKKKKNPETEESTENTSAPQATPEEFVRIWNEGRGLCPKVLRLSGTRAARARARIAEFGKTREEQTAVMLRLMEEIRGSSFLQTKWTCNFAWLVGNPENWVKVLEGNYRDGTARKRAQAPSGYRDEMDRIDRYFDGTGDADTQG